MSAYEDLIGRATFRLKALRPGRALPILRGLGIHRHGGNEPHLYNPSASYYHPRRFSMTKPRQAFTRVRPSGLSLACGAVMAQRAWAFPLGCAPRHYQRRTPGWEQALDTRLGLLLSHLLSRLSTPPKRLRVAPFQSRRPLTASAAWRSVRFSRYGNTVTRAKRQGAKAGWPVAENSAATSSSEYKLPNSSHSFMMTPPLEKAVLAILTVALGMFATASGFSISHYESLSTSPNKMRRTTNPSKLSHQATSGEGAKHVS